MDKKPNSPSPSRDELREMVRAMKREQDAREIAECRRGTQRIINKVTQLLVERTLRKRR